MKTPAQISWDEAKKGHFEWEMVRRPDTWLTLPYGRPIPLIVRWVAVALELVADNLIGLPTDASAQLQNAIFAKQADALVGQFEIDRVDGDKGQPHSRLTFLIRRLALPSIVKWQFSGFTVNILSIGAPFEDRLLGGKGWPPLSLRAKTPSMARTKEQASNAGSQPLIGIIDDGISFLNKRFCTKNGNDFLTRFEAIWLQSELFGPPPFLLPEVPVGEVLDQGYINQKLQSEKPEADVYREINAKHYPPPSQQATNTSVAHGTHVLDLAAGEDPSIGGPPLIAVQLAPGMAWDTSGRRLGMFLVMGLRWMVTRALEADPRRDLVVNISLGSLAGPGDATNFVANSIQYEIDTFQRLTGRKMRVVIAYGNSWRSDLVAELKLAKDEEKSVDWRILPDGYSSSYLEIRVPTGSGATVTLTPPDGGKPVKWSFGAPSTAINSPSSSAVVGQILPLPNETRAHAVLIAIAPTASLEPDGLPLAPAGAWKVMMSAAGADCTATLRVQRNDTPVGYRVYGRQSYLADAGMGAWDEEMRDHTAPGVASTIKRQGTANAFAGLPDMVDNDASGIYYVGAVRPDPGGLQWPNDYANRKIGQDQFALSPYSSQGYAGTKLAENTDFPTLNLKIDSKGPTLAALGDNGRFFSGLKAASVNSGARTLRLSGTSIAAALVTRQVAEALKNRTPLPQELATVLSINQTGTRDSRIGLGIVPP